MLAFSSPRSRKRRLFPFIQPGDARRDLFIGEVGPAQKAEIPYEVL
jgi:hypothetical protein